MNFLPRVTELTRERVAREFDELGPDACMASVIEELDRHNPELLDMARRCASDIGSERRVMVGFAMFYRLLATEAAAASGQRTYYWLPRITPDTRDVLVREIDESGSETFTMQSIGTLESTNPELLRMAHHFATRQPDYLGVMQGFALMYRSLLAEVVSGRTLLH